MEIKRNAVVVPEKHFEFFKAGDLVRLKGTENDQPQYTMRVICMEWQKDDRGRLVRSESGKKIPIGLRVTCFTDIGEPVEKILDARSVYKVERTGKYYLIEAKKHFVNCQNNEVVRLINETLDLL